MLFLITATPSAYSRLSTDLVRSIASYGGSPVEAVSVHDLESFYAAYKKKAGQPFVASLSANDERILHLLERTQTKIAIFEGDFAETVGVMMVRRKVALDQATKTTTALFSGSATLATATGAVSYPWPHEGALMRPFVQSLALFYGIEPTEDLIAHVAADLKMERIGPRTTILSIMRPHFPDHEQTLEALAGLSSSQIDMLRELSEGYQAVSRGQADAMTWPAAALGISDPVELLGKARRIVAGPAYCLPPGTWLIDFTVTLSGNLSRNNIAAKLIVGANHFPDTQTGIVEDGKFGFTLRCTVERPNQPVTLVIKTLEGAIEGYLSMSDVLVRRDTQEAPPTP
jgi:hypothetical protein